MLVPPISDQAHYVEHLGDVDYWGAYVWEIARREGLRGSRIEAPFVGTFPTFLIGEYVVKLFGPGFDGAKSWAAEQAMQRLLDSCPGVPAPGFLASGTLLDDWQEWTWPYLVTRRLRGQPVRERPLTGTAGMSIAERLGEAVATLHTLTPPDEVDSRPLLPQLRATAPSRLTEFGLPAHLAEQVPDYLDGAPRPTTLVHADITADHVFHDGRTMIGIIDWGDAIVADPFYDLVPLAFDCLDADPKLLDAFLQGYGWVVGPDFAHNMVRAICEFQFDVITRVRAIVDLDSIFTLDDLADRLVASFRT